MQTSLVQPAKSRLRPRSRTLLDAPDSARISHCYESIWVPYPAGIQALSRISHLHEYPRNNRTPGLLLHGPSNNGKTVLVDRFVSENPNQLDDFGEIEKRKSLRFQMPANPTEQRIYSQILAAYGSQFRGLPHKMTTELRALQILHQHTPQMLIVDDLQHIMSGTPRTQLRVLNHLKFLGTELRIPVIAVGTKEVHSIMQSDPQLATKFKAVEMPIWKSGFELAAFVSAFGANLPLRKRSSLSDSQLLDALLALSGGLTGEITALLSQAAELAIRLKTERITLPLIERAAAGEVFTLPRDSDI